MFGTSVASLDQFGYQFMRFYGSKLGMLGCRIVLLTWRGHQRACDTDLSFSLMAGRYLRSN